MGGEHQYCGRIASVLQRNNLKLQLFSKYFQIPSETFYKFLSVEPLIYVHSTVGQQLSVKDMGAQVKDLIVLAELSLIPFSFIFEIQQSVQVILIVNFFFHLESKREWIVLYSHWNCLSPCQRSKIWRVRRRSAVWQGERQETTSRHQGRWEGKFSLCLQRLILENASLASKMPKYTLFHFRGLVLVCINQSALG